MNSVDPKKPKRGMLGFVGVAILNGLELPKVCQFYLLDAGWGEASSPST
jgi:hypothetical protein